MDSAEKPDICVANSPNNMSETPSTSINTNVKPETPRQRILSKGVENAKKRLRAFSIQKKTPIAPTTVMKAPGSSSATVVIGKIGANVKTTPKVDDEQKKLPKPPKPGSGRKYFQDSYSDLQKRTLAEIEDMKRKMELVELGIPLGLICPTSTNDKAMPTKAMPPIKHLLDPAKVDEIICEAKKARDEGKTYKFDYQNFLPEYDNPFQRKKDDPHVHDKNKFDNRIKVESEREYEKDRRRSDRHSSRRYSDYKRDDKDRHKDRDKEKSKDKTRERTSDKIEDKDKDDKGTNVNLNDYLVCDSWSLENDDKNSLSSVKSSTSKQSIKDPQTHNIISEMGNESGIKNTKNDYLIDSPVMPVKIKKLQPVIDSFKFEIDPNDDEILDIFDEDASVEKYAQNKKSHLYSPTNKSMDFDQDKDVSMDPNDDTFLESIINEIKQEDMSDVSQDKGLVEYDISPIKGELDDDSTRRVSITPELDDRMRVMRSQQSDYSEGYRSSESGYKTSDSSERRFKSVNSFRISLEKDLDEEIHDIRMSKSTVESLETWSFVLKICQPILFRHDKNKCYKETRTLPKLWYTENPKICNCVKDRGAVYKELQMSKMNLVDRVYGYDQIPDASFPKCRNWYPRPNACFADNYTVQLSSEWEAEDSQGPQPSKSAKGDSRRRRPCTPQHSDEVLLDSEYQRFMEAVWPEVSEPKTETPKSMTPVRQEARKKKKDESEKELENKKSVKKMKLSSEGWSQESDLEDEDDKSKKMKIEKEKQKLRKRKYSTSTLSSLSESEAEARKKKKLLKKKAIKKSKSKSAKCRRMGKKLLRKLKEKAKKKKKRSKMDEDSDDEVDSDDIKSGKKRQRKMKKKSLKRKKKAESSSSSSSTSSESSSDESDKKAKKARKVASKKKKEKRHKRKKSTSDSGQSEDLFDVNILNNIKTERLTDDEKSKVLMDFSPRRQQKPREIINVKELQNDFVGNNIHIKKEVEEEPPPKEIIIEAQKEVASQPQKQFVSQRQIEIIPESLKETIPELQKEILLRKEIVPQIQNEIALQAHKEIEPQVQQITFAQGHRDILSQGQKEIICSTQKEIVHDVQTDTVTQVQKDLISERQKEGISPLQKETVSKPHKERFRASKEDVFVVQSECSEGRLSSVYEKSFEKADEELQTVIKPIPQISHLKAMPDESNLSQCSSQESVVSIKPYEKDDSHLRPSSQNSNYSFNDVINSSHSGLYSRAIQPVVECEDKFQDVYHHDNYEMYEHLAMAYQSDVASQQVSPPCSEGGEQRIETVVRTRSRGEIKCDWRAGMSPALHTPATRPSRWGLKPGQVNIVLTGGGDQFRQSDYHQSQTQPPPQEPPPPPPPQRMTQVYQIQSLANRSDVGPATGYDEAYNDMYGASDRLQYGDCFADVAHTMSVGGTSGGTNEAPVISDKETRVSTLDARIDHALRNTVLGEVAKEVENVETAKDTPEKGILVTRSGVASEPGRGAKRVSFADGYKPGQDSDVEEPPVKKKRRSRRVGCAWPCPASHPDHVSLWDALPPPPPPPGSPPPPPGPSHPPPLHLLRPPPRPVLQPPHPHPQKFDPNCALPGFMPPEPPPGLINFQ